MKAMILAAGLGTRLRPLTDDRPKALVEVAGRTMLEMTLARLHTFGVHDVIVNVHHYADMIRDYLHAHHNFGMRIEISAEEVLLDTGGGLKKAAWFFLQGGDTEPFIVHNVDVLSDIDLASMVRFHAEHQALATLAVQSRVTSRLLLFDDHGELCGRHGAQNAQNQLVRPATSTVALAFSGIHVVSPALLLKLTQEGAFSIISSYLALAAQGQKILAFRADRYRWRDLGRPEHVMQAARELDSATWSGD